MNLADRRAAVRAALIADPQRSARSIRDDVGVRWDMIARIRAELIAEKAIPDGPIRRRNGRVYRVRSRGTTRRAHDFNDRIDRLIDDMTAPHNAGIWRRARPGTVERTVANLERLYRLTLNLKHRLPRERPAVEREARVHRDPSRRPA